MAMIFITSDTHYGHSNILNYCPNRKFSTIEEHDQHLVEQWNKRVSSNDMVFHLGDFCFGPSSVGCEILDRLNGSKILVAGNHDTRALKNKSFRQKFLSVKDSYFEINIDNNFFVFCHYPLESWNKMRYGSYHFHGHTHTPEGETRLKPLSHRKDVGVDSRGDHAPWLITELL